MAASLQYFAVIYLIIFENKYEYELLSFALSLSLSKFSKL